MKRQSGRALVGIIVGLVLLMLVTLLFTNGSSIFGQGSTGKTKEGQAVNSPRPDGKGETLVGRAQLAAKDSVCRQQLAQVRQSIQINTDPVEETKPADLAALRLGSTIIACSVGKEPYTYDPATGSVTCPHPGHEKY